MNKLIKGGIVFSVLLLGIVYMSVSDKMGDGDMVNILSIVAAVTIVVVAIGVVLKYVNQMQNDKADGQDSGHDWDGIREYMNKLPMGWAVSFIGLIIFTGLYFLVLYPLNSYSQIGEYNEEVAKHNAKFQKEYANLSDIKLYDMGESVYLVSCAPCHGVIGDGQSGKAADLTKWGSAQTVKDILNHGSSIPSLGQVMPDRNAIFGPDGQPINDQQIDAVSNWIASYMPMADKEGMGVYMNYCSSCHAQDGSGYDGTVAADLRSLRGFFEFIVTNGKKGHIGTMPAFKNLLNPTQIKAVSVYIEEEYKSTRR